MPALCCCCCHLAVPCPLFAECTQLEDPRLEWRAVQEAMLRDYLQTAQDVLEVRNAAVIKSRPPTRRASGPAYPAGGWPP